MYLQELRGEVSQGDVFGSLLISYVRQEVNRPVTMEVSATIDIPAMLITYDCEYDKPSTKLVLVAGVFPLAEVPLNRQGNVRKNKIFSTFYLEKTASQEEAFVDFRYIGSLEKTIVAQEAENGSRIISLSDEAQLALQEQLSAFFGYGRNR